MRHAFWALLLLAPLSAATADQVLTDGTVVAEGTVIDGYQYRAGYYWQGQQAYEKYKDWWQESVYYRTPYYHYKYEWKWKWAYSPVAVAYPVPPLPVPPEVPADFEKQALQILHKQQRLATYMEVFRLLGGNAAPYASGMPAHYGLGGAGAVLSGNTAYVRTVATKADYYGTAADLGAQALLFGQQFGIMSRDSQTYADKALERYGAFNARHQELLGILAKAEAARMIIAETNRIQPQINIRTETREPFIPTNPNPPGILPKPGDGAKLQAFGELVGTKCGQCHGADPAKLQGGLDLRDWPNFDAGKKQKVMSRVMLPADNPKRMPPAPNAALTNEEKLMFLGN